ncbi:MAG: glutamate--tRNA ligase [Parcubacteria bacterium C7867-006]|nr:MAG: glutamate--tRNA ligase [Parcubacteria bacterium C7867-006]
MQEKNQKVVTRFAPSPTGFMHIGGVRTALFAYLYARKNNGTFILRIEDTDKEREVPGSIKHIQESLTWLGIDWDFGPDKHGDFGSTIQSERLPTYIEYAHKLIEKGLAYPDPYTQEELAEFRKKADEEKRPFLYRDYRPEVFEKWDGKKPLRFKVPEIKRYKWNDVVRGELEAGEEALDDFILIKSDGYPTYNFAHIIDDLNMGVTHIMRGDEFISSTPRFLSLYNALEIEPPIFVSLPPILRDDRTKKLGKRDGAKDILEYREEGYLPEAMLNFLALIGWNPGTEQEIFTKDELIKAFDINKIQKAGGAFNEEKLDWMNKEHLRKLPVETVRDEISNRLKKNPTIGENEKLNDRNFLAKISDIVMDHISKWSDIDIMVGAGEIEYFFESPQYDHTLLYWKGNEDKETTKKHLEWVIETLKSADESFDSSDKVKSLIFDYATENGRGEVLWPLRVSLSGKEKSPDPFTLIYVLGRDESIKRITDAIGKLL